MIWLCGLTLGIGVVLLASRWLWPHKPERQPKPRRLSKWRALATEAGYPGLEPWLIGVLCAASALVASGIVVLAMRNPVAALVAAVGGALLPVLVLRGARNRRRTARRKLWPDVCDLLVAATRAGMSLPDSVASLADIGPEPLRSAFARFRDDFSASGHFDSSAQRLKDEVADATADRIIETLRMARQVGGTQLPSVLRALSAAVRADVAVRGEVLAKQSWVRASAVLGLVAPWAILGLLSLRPEAASAYATPGGFVLIVVTAVVSVCAYQLMRSIGSLPEPRRWFG